jgi:serine/threonine protein kinase
MPKSKKCKSNKRISKKASKQIKKRISKRKNKGGNVLGKGTYGCVIHPNIECDDYKSSNENISKIINKSNLDDEYNIVTKLDLNMPNIKNYLILPLKYCDNLGKININADLRECMKELKLSKIDDNINIIQEYGGISLIDYRNKNMNESFDKMIEYYKQLFEVVIFLNKHNLVHRDIKYDNIVINEKNKKLKLIDIGLMNVINESDINDINSDLVIFDKDEIKKKGNHIYPLEIYCFSDIYDNNQLLKIDNEVINSFMTQYSKYWLKNNNINRYYQWIYNHITKINNDIENINMSMLDIDEDENEIYKWKTEFNKKLDVFSVGTVLIREIEMIGHNKFNKSNELLKELVQFIFENMLHQDCRMRIDIKTAYNKFIDICKKYLII